MVNGMYYNPETLRWEGNDHVLSAFNPPASSPSTASLPPYLLREKENATPRPALIANRGTQGVQVVGGMVFDPVNMCWLKLGPPPNARSDPNDPMDGFNALDDDEDDVFKDIPDLEDNTSTTLANGGDSSDSNAGMSSHGGIGGGRGSGVGTSGGRMSDINDWLVGEEFDVGPEFIRRQREEEERWRKKCERWLGTSSMAAPPRDQEAWRWTIRDLVLDS